jgi:hypothetical protein
MGTRKEAYFKRRAGPTCRMGWRVPLTPSLAFQRPPARACSPRPQLCSRNIRCTHPKGKQPPTATLAARSVAEKPRTNVASGRPSHRTSTHERGCGGGGAAPSPVPTQQTPCVCAVSRYTHAYGPCARAGPGGRASAVGGGDPRGRPRRCQHPGRRARRGGHQGERVADARHGGRAGGAHLVPHHEPCVQHPHLGARCQAAAVATAAATAGVTAGRQE